MSFSYGIKAIVGLIPINLHLQKLGGRSQLHTSKLLPSHLIHSLINSRLNSDSYLNIVTLNSLTNRQWSMVKGHLVDLANRINKCFPSFNPLNLEFSPGLRVIDNFQIAFLSIYLIKKNMINCVPKYLMKWSWSPLLLHLSPS